jgi:hypothetical protein
MHRTLKIFAFGLLAILLSAPVFATPKSDGVIGDGHQIEDVETPIDQQQPPPAEDAPTILLFFLPRQCSNSNHHLLKTHRRF